MPFARISASRNVLTSVSKAIVRLGVLGVPALAGGCGACCVRNFLIFTGSTTPSKKAGPHHVDTVDVRQEAVATSVQAPLLDPVV